MASANLEVSVHTVAFVSSRDMKRALRSSFVLKSGPVKHAHTVLVAFNHVVEI